MAATFLHMFKPVHQAYLMISDAIFSPKHWAVPDISHYYSTNCNTIQMWSWCSRYLSSVGNRYPAIYVASYVGRKSEVKKMSTERFKSVASFVINLLNNKAIILLNLAEYRRLSIRRYSARFRRIIVNYYSTNCNTIQIWSWCSRYLSSVGNRYPAIYVASHVGRKSEVKKCRQKDLKMLRVLLSICWIIKQLSCSISRQALWLIAVWIWPKTKFRRPTSHEPNRMQMRKILQSLLLAYDLAHVNLAQEAEF